MTKYLVTFSVGPVQGFIASARRIRDLWSGSWLLSELSKACAKNLKQQGATLIFPHVTSDTDLEVNSSFSVGNKIQAVIDTADELTDIITNAKHATHQRFKDEADHAWRGLSAYHEQLRKDIWQSQLNDYVEIQVAWSKIDERTSYHDAVQNVARVLASRKATRDFLPSAISPYQSERMIPKSSLDGMRETVLLEEKSLKDGLRKKLSLSKSEQLDTAGVVKRLGFGEAAEQFTPFTRVTAHAWLEQIADKEPQALAQLKDIYRELVTLGVATAVRGNNKIYQDFPYDAQLLYPSRLDVAHQEWYGDDAVLDNLKLLKSTLRPLYQKYGEPYRYGVMLLADGDRMGELLDKATSADEHQAITAALSNFASKVAETMRCHAGHCIYAGGDDVLGFVPLDKAYDCADKLQQLFASSLKDVAEKLNVEKSPTLSVGLAICHIMTPLGVIRELAQQAEKYAKGDHITKADEKEFNQRRNALGVLLSVRSGTDTKLRFNWDDESGINAFKKMISYYINSKIPSRIAYDVRTIYLRTCSFALHDEVLQKNIQIAELTRMLKQARTDKGQELAKNIIDDLVQRGCKIGLDGLANELIVARWFAAKTQKELGKE